VLRNTFSVSWQEYQLGVIHADNSWAALILLGVALLVYVLQNRNRPGLS
jgi:hypothetical protein